MLRQRICVSRLSYRPHPFEQRLQVRLGGLERKVRFPWSVSETATAPTDALVIWPSVIGVQLSPLSVVFHNPPPVAPK